jgi:hypothetical protein
VKNIVVACWAASGVFAKDSSHLKLAMFFDSGRGERALAKLAVDGFPLVLLSQHQCLFGVIY